MPGYIIDLDGTLYAGTNPIPQAAPFIDSLRRAGSPYLFVTNNSSRTPDEVARHLREIAGIPAAAEDVLTSAQAAARYQADAAPGSRVYAIGEQGLRQALAKAGLHLVEGPDDKPDAVIQGIDRSFTYAKLFSASRAILGGAAFIATNSDLQLPTEQGLTPGSGSLSLAIRAASGVEPVWIGKPSPIIMNYAIERLGLPADEIWVVGDNLRTDIAGGIAAGCRTAWVLTGIAQDVDPEEQIRITSIKPELVLRHLLDWPA
ncbi:TIGR01457 family HAD-type hydrolase [Gorillibacterium timonense]|uniref:TIGR01457 family HAD-type hydrolase n=1 Tax=Gorillibacterium timonense TaxID=1689269 RepID=UPI00071CBFB0|nr:TIGR01457 family HAD-type hydrolase [Gorillibacterium timonense]